LARGVVYVGHVILSVLAGGGRAPPHKPKSRGSDTTDREYLMAFTDDLISFWRSNVKVIASH